MRLVNPIGRDKIETIADFDITPYAGCSCIMVEPSQPVLFSSVEALAPPPNCACNCIGSISLTTTAFQFARGL